MQNLKINLPFSLKKMYIYSMKKLPFILAVLALVAVFAFGFSLGKIKEKNDLIKQQEIELSKEQEEKKERFINETLDKQRNLPEEKKIPESLIRLMSGSGK
jgi:preprotein translocase subunit SecF